MALIDVDATGHSARYRSQHCDYYRFVRTHKRERERERWEEERKRNDRKRHRQRETNKERGRKKEERATDSFTLKRKSKGAKGHDAIVSQLRQIWEKESRCDTCPKSTGPTKSLASRCAREEERRDEAAVARGVNRQSYGGPITIRRALISHNAPFFLPGRTTELDAIGRVARGTRPRERVARARSTFTISQ